MADNVSIKDSADVARDCATDEIGGRHFQIVKAAFGADNAVQLVDGANGLPVTILGTVPVSGTVAVSGTIPVSGTVTANGPLTDTQLRAAAVPVSGAVTVSGTVTASGPLTDTQLRATPVPHVGTRANDGSATAAGNAHLTVGGSDGTNLRPLSVDTAGKLNVLTADAFVTGQGSQLTINNNIVLAAAGAGNYDAINYKTVALQIVPAAGTVTAGAITFEASNDNVNWQAIGIYDVASLTANPVTTYTIVASTPRYFRGPLSFRHFRARISTGVTGTTTGVQCFSRFSPETFANVAQTVISATAANLLATVSATNLSCNVGQINAVAPLMGNGVTGTGSLRVTLASDNTANTNPFVYKNPTPTQSFINSAATTNATSVKGSAGTLFGVICSNAGGAAAFVKFYNKATAPTVGTDVPVVTIAVPAGGHAELTTGNYGHQFGTGIALAITNLVADSDTTAVAAAQVKVATSYV